MEQIAWASRLFNFDFPAGMFPVIIGRLKGAYPRIVALARDVSPHAMINQPDGKWSIQQHIGHLIDLEELHDGRIIDFKNREPILRAWDGVNKKTEEANHNAKKLGDLLNEFNRVRTNFVNALLEFTDDALVRTAIHPRLNKPMRVVDMAFFVAEHDDHHIAKMISIATNNAQ